MAHAGGRPRLPESTKKLKGTARPSRSNPRAPQVPKGIPDMPLRVKQSEVAAAFWTRVTKHLHTMKVITIQDEIALEQMCLIYAEMVSLESELYNADGLRVATYKSYTKNGTTEKTKPQVQQIMELRRQFAALLQQFGMTPATRDKVNAEVPVQTDLFENALSGTAQIRKVS